MGRVAGRLWITNSARLLRAELNAARERSYELKGRYPAPIAKANSTPLGTQAGRDKVGFGPSVGNRV